jgi:hypothetical protein
MSTMTENISKATGTRKGDGATVKAAVNVPTWATIKQAYKAAETSGVKARFKANDAVVRAYALTDETSTDAKTGAVTARSEADRSREVLDALNIVSGNVFGLSAMRVGQLVKVYRAIGVSGTDPFSDQGRALFTPFDAIRKADVNALPTVAKAVEEAAEGKAGDVLAKAVETAKETAKARTAANKAAKDAAEPKTVTVTGLSQVVKFAEAALPMVRKVSATATPEEKAEARKALEALIAHLA